eukprot:385092_1
MPDWRDTTGFQYVAVGVSCIITFGICIIFIVELYQTVVTIKKRKNINSKFTIHNAHSYYFAFPLVIYLCYIFNGLSHIIINLKLSENCAVFDLLASLTYAFSKFFLYEFFILFFHLLVIFV